RAPALRARGITPPLPCVPTTPGSALNRHVGAGITLGVQSAAEAAALAPQAAAPVSVFLKIDAGFGRVGAPLPVAASEAREIARLPSVTLAGLFTHLPFFSEESVAWVQERLKACGEVAGALQGDAGR